MIRDSTVRWLLVAGAFLLLPEPRIAIALTAQVHIDPALVPERFLWNDIKGDELPAISSDRTEVAVLYQSGDGLIEVSVDILSTANSKRLKRFMLIPESGSGLKTSDAAREALWDKLVAPNQYLTRKHFVSMKPLFIIDSRANPPQAKNLLPSFADVRYDLYRGDINISRAEDGASLLYFRRPVIDQTGDGANFPITLTQQVPMAGWVDAESGTAVLRLETKAPDLIMYPDEWVIVHLDAEN